MIPGNWGPGKMKRKKHREGFRELIMGPGDEVARGINGFRGNYPGSLKSFQIRGLG